MTHLRPYFFLGSVRYLKQAILLTIFIAYLLYILIITITILRIA